MVLRVSASRPGTEIRVGDLAAAAGSTVTVEALRSYALSLPETIESPHFESTSFRVRAKIFVTIPPAADVAHVFVDDDEAAAAVARHPHTYEILVWGKKQWGVKAKLAGAPADDLFELVEDAWYRKAPKRVAAAYELSRLNDPQ
jgi:hypothetical protein